jgi:exonuclease SbcD
LPELEAVLENLGDFIERERVDLLLMSGDVFDSRGPSAAAERAVFRFFRRVGKSGTKTALIAGNHDDPLRLEAWGTLAEFVDVMIVARPRPADQGGVIEFEVRSGERAIIAAVPFAKTSDLVSATEMSSDDTTAHQRYAEGMRRFVEVLTTRFRPDSINVLMAHTHLDGAVLAGSERLVDLGGGVGCDGAVIAFYCTLCGARPHPQAPADRSRTLTDLLCRLPAPAGFWRIRGRKVVCRHPC